MIENIDYTVRVSRRARYARIVVRPNLSVEVVLPEGVSRQRAAALLQEKREWIERSLKRFGEHARIEPVADSSGLPQQVDFEALAVSIPILYRHTGSGRVRVVEVESKLNVTGNIADIDMVKTGLQKWLKRKTKELLPAMLEELAQAHGFRHQKVTIRLQKSRWGSCTRGGNISLNAKLLFLPMELLRYVMLHELAQLKHMNHSKAFWDVVAACDEGYLLHRKEMRRVSCWIPAWAEV
jgi:predicted metal-dependent hydrolase